MPLVIDGKTSKIPRHMPYTPGSYMVQFGSMTGQGVHTSWLYNHPESTQSFRQNNKELQDQINKADILIAHNMKFKMMWMKKLGIDFSRPRVWCTQVAQYLLEGQFKGPKGYYSLDEVAERRGFVGKLDRVKLFWESGYDTDEIPADVLIPYNRQDNVVCGNIYCQQVSEMNRIQHLTPIIQMQMRQLSMLAEIEMNGMLVHLDLLKKLNKEYTQKVANYNAELEDLSGVSINWRSSPQVSSLLFGGTYTVKQREDYLFYYKGHEKYGTWKNRKVDVPIILAGLGFEPPRGAKPDAAGHYSVAENVIKSLKGRDKTQKRFLQILQDRSKAEKLRSTYFEGMQTKLIGEYIHPSMNQTIARNGRFTSSSPNGQNIPRGSTCEVKSIFISRFD